MNTVCRSVCLGMMALAVSLFGAEAIAQQPSTTPAAKTAPAPPKAPAAKAKVKTKAKTTSACKGREQKACAAKSECSWIAATKRKDGKQVKAYCRTKSARAATKS